MDSVVIAVGHNLFYLLSARGETVEKITKWEKIRGGNKSNMTLLCPGFLNIITIFKFVSQDDPITCQNPSPPIAELGASSRQTQYTLKALCLSVLNVCSLSLSPPQRSWVEVCMFTRISFYAMQTQSTGKTLSKTHVSILWWCPPTAALYVSKLAKL